MSTTPLRTLLLAALLALPVGWVVARGYERYGAGLPDVPWSTPALLGFLALLLVVLARTVRGWVLQRRHDRRMGPLVVSRLLALAKAGAVCGALVAGGYGGVLLAALPYQDLASGPRRLALAGLTVLAGVCVTAAGLLLERACRVPPRADEDHPDVEMPA